MIRCPITNKDIDIGTCASITYVVDGCIKESSLPEEIKKNKNWKNVCKECKYHDN